MLKNCAFKIAVAAVLIASIGSIASAQEQPAAGGIGIPPKTVGETAGGSDTKAKSGSGTTDAAAVAAKARATRPITSAVGR